MATAQVIAFDQSIKFLESIGIDNVMKHEAELVEYGQELLQKNNSNIKINFKNSIEVNKEKLCGIQNIIIIKRIRKDIGKSSFPHRF